MSQLIRLGIGGAGLLLLAFAYVFQFTDFLNFLTQTAFHPFSHFAFNRGVRILLNDSGMLLIIYAIFNNREILRVAIAIQLVDLLILFPIYLALKLPQEGTTELSSPFLSQLHRLIVNPILMILLIPGIAFQRYLNKSLK